MNPEFPYRVGQSVIDVAMQVGQSSPVNSIHWNRLFGTSPHPEDSDEIAAVRRKLKIALDRIAECEQHGDYRSTADLPKYYGKFQQDVKDCHRQLLEFYAEKIVSSASSPFGPGSAPPGPSSPPTSSPSPSAPPG